MNHITRTSVEEIVKKYKVQDYDGKRDTAQCVTDLMALLEPEKPYKSWEETLLEKDYSAGRADGLATPKENLIAGWEEKFDATFDSRFNPHGFNPKTHTYMPVEKLKSFITRVAQASEERGANRAVDYIEKHAWNNDETKVSFVHVLRKTLEEARNQK